MPVSIFYSIIYGVTCLRCQKVTHLSKVIPFSLKQVRMLFFFVLMKLLIKKSSFYYLATSFYSCKIQKENIYLLHFLIFAFTYLKLC